MLCCAGGYHYLVTSVSYSTIQRGGVQSVINSLACPGILIRLPSSGPSNQDIITSSHLGKYPFANPSNPVSLSNQVNVVSLALHSKSSSIREAARVKASLGIVGEESVSKSPVKTSSSSSLRRRWASSIPHEFCHPIADLFDLEHLRVFPCSRP